MFPPLRGIAKELLSRLNVGVSAQAGRLVSTTCSPYSSCSRNLGYRALQHLKMERDHLMEGKRSRTNATHGRSAFGCLIEFHPDLSTEVSVYSREPNGDECLGSFGGQVFELARRLVSCALGCQKPNANACKVPQAKGVTMEAVSSWAAALPPMKVCECSVYGL